MGEHSPWISSVRDRDGSQRLHVLFRLHLLHHVKFVLPLAMLHPLQQKVIPADSGWINVGGMVVISVAVQFEHTVLQFIRMLQLPCEIIRSICTSQCCSSCGVSSLSFGH